MQASVSERTIFGVFHMLNIQNTESTKTFKKRWIKGVDNWWGVCYYNWALRRAATERHERVGQRGAWWESERLIKTVR